MTTLIHPTYFPSISHYVIMIQAKKLVFEAHDNFQKQTNRNRTYIYSANGKQLLNIPIVNGNLKTYKDIKLEKDTSWQKHHLKTLQSAYRSSPYFDYFEDELMPIFTKKYKFLWDLNLEIHQIITVALGVNVPYELTKEYNTEVTNDIIDTRYLVNGKKDVNKFNKYTQVFQEKHGFINNLSILDLLFNEGRNAVDYLLKQKVNINLNTK